MRRLVLFLIVLGLAAAESFAQTRSAKTLDIYVVDVEGGNATLFVAPSGESVLIDTGNGGAAAEIAPSLVETGGSRLSARYAICSC